jgi:ribosomal-protein-alanine N-acetyltransferase
MTSASDQRLPEFAMLTGRKVALRPFGLADVTAAYLGWLNDPEVVRYSNQRFRRHDSASSAAYLASFAGTDNLFLSIRRLDDEASVGTMTAYRSRHHGTVDVGIMVGDRESWGQGIGQDAWNTLSNWLLGPGRMRKLTCGTLACNGPMRAIAQRSGMVLEAVRRDQEIVDGVLQDMLYFARFHSDP